MKRARTVLCLSSERKLRYGTIYSLCFVAERRFCEFVGINILKPVKQDENAVNQEAPFKFMAIGKKIRVAVLVDSQ